ncbi:MAG: enhanced serine sensitivity protein SseB C-terminal domain-containing protein [Candidatus Sumerlaeaceae bacterium]
MGILQKFFRKKESRTTNPDLLKCLLAFCKTPTPPVRKRFYEAFLKATPIVALSEAPGFVQTSGERSFVTDSNLELPFIGAHNEDGVPYAVAFTDMDVMLKWDPNSQHYIALPSKALLDIITANSKLCGLSINPSNPEALWVSRPELETLARGVVPEFRTDKISTSPLKKGARIGIRPADSAPQYLEQVLRESCRSCPEIMSAYLLEMKVDDSKPKLAVGLLCNPVPGSARKTEVTQLLGASSEAVKDWTQDISFLFLESPQMLAIAGQCPAFYKAS